MDVVRGMFGTVISRFGDIAWPARSPDLAAPDFFLWGFLKDRVFRRRIMTIQEIKQAIVDEVATIDDDLRRRVYGNFRKRLQECIDLNGGHLSDVIFKKSACNLLVLNGIVQCIYRRFRFVFPVTIPLSMTL
jgi:hypothetical protein